MISTVITISYRSYNNEVNEIKKEIRTLENVSYRLLNFLDENKSKLEEYKKGNEYELHNPFFQEVEKFINNYSLKSTKEGIDTAKNKGLRCAYVQVIMSEKLYMYNLIGFNTIDKGMIYYEIGNERIVYPEIGKKYKNCIINNNKNFSTFNDTIIDIIHIW